MAELLQVDAVWAGYGNATVLEDISFSLEPGASLALLGRNGMGKTTLLATLMGATRQLRGRIRFDNRDLTLVPSHRRARAGLGWVPQERDIFPSLSVEENLTVVARPGLWNLQKIYATFPRLQERRANMGNQLSGGEQQMLALGRALMVNPRLLLLDEPLEGLAPLIVQELLGHHCAYGAAGQHGGHSGRATCPPDPADYPRRPRARTRTRRSPRAQQCARRRSGSSGPLVGRRRTLKRKPPCRP